MEKCHQVESKIDKQRHLLELVTQVAGEEGFEIKRLDDIYGRYYVPAAKNGHRCVDGRGLLESYGDGSPTGFQNKEYLGNQFPGGTFGLLGALRVVTKIGENEARKIIARTCGKNGIRMGSHIDDSHGQIQTAGELTKRTEGCGNQKAAANGEIPMYRGLVSREIIDERLAWLKSKNAAIAVLTGEHREKLAALNLEPGKTFNTREADKNGEPLFNADLPAAYNLAGIIFDELKTRGEPGGSSTREIFQDEFAKAVVRDCMQTLRALVGGDKLYIHAAT